VDHKVQSYPEIVYGWKPWKLQSTTKALPIKISQMKEIIVTYEIETRAEGRYNVVFYIWLTRSSQPAYNHISKQEYISSIEFGNEIISGSGKTVIKRYAISIK
jgi:hypothetical protein